MRFLTHRIVSKIPENPLHWDKLKLDETIFLNVTSDFYDFVYNKRQVYDRYIGGSLGGYAAYYSDKRAARGDEPELLRGSTILVLTDSMPCYDLTELEGELINENVIDEAFIIDGKESKAFYKSVYAKYKKLRSSERNILSHRSNLVNASREHVEHVNGFDVLRKRYNILKRNGLLSGVKEYIFENVIAEDSNAVGPDIDLGTLRFKVDFKKSKVELLDHPDSRERVTPFNPRSKHPHQMNPGICLGTQEADFYLALENWDVSIVEALLYKFAYSYNSMDGAGNKYGLWEKEMVIDAGGTFNILLEEAVNSEKAGGWILRTEAVEIYGTGSDNWYYKRYCKLCTNTDTWYPESEVILSTLIGTYIPIEGAVELENGKGWVPADYDKMIQYRRKYYHLDDTVEMPDSRRIPESYVVFSVPMDQYILKSTAVEHEGKSYTKEALDAYLATQASIEVEAPQETELLVTLDLVDDAATIDIFQDSIDMYRQMTGSPNS